MSGGGQTSRGAGMQGAPQNLSQPRWANADTTSSGGIQPQSQSQPQSQQLRLVPNGSYAPPIGNRSVNAQYSNSNLNEQLAFQNQSALAMTNGQPMHTKIASSSFAMPATNNTQMTNRSIRSQNAATLQHSAQHPAVTSSFVSGPTNSATISTFTSSSPFTTSNATGSFATDNSTAATSNSNTRVSSRTNHRATSHSRNSSAHSRGQRSALHTPNPDQVPLPSTGTMSSSMMQSVSSAVSMSMSNSQSAASDLAREAVVNESLFMAKVKLSSDAIQRGDYRKAVQYYAEVLQLDPTNHTLFSNRAAAYLNMGMYEEALNDARQSTQLRPDWIKGYLREGIALECLGRFSDALLAFTNGLTKDPKSGHLLDALIQSTLKSPLRNTFEPVYTQLKRMKLDASPFVILSVIGQSLLTDKSASSAPGGSNDTLKVVSEILECALRIGTDSLKLQSSVYSTLSYVYWTMGKLDQAVIMMQHDLHISTQLNDLEQQCRAHGNLASAYFAKRCYKEALASFRMQLALSMRLKQTVVATDTLKHLATLYKILGDTHNALASAKQCVILIQKQIQLVQNATQAQPIADAHSADQAAMLRDLRWSLAEQIANCAGLYVAAAKFDQAAECLNEQSRLLDTLRAAPSTTPNDQKRLVILDCELQFHFGNLNNLQRQFRVAEAHLRKLLQLVEAHFPAEFRGASGTHERSVDELKDTRDEELARVRRFVLAAYAILGAIALTDTRDLPYAKQCFERQLDCALKAKSKQQEARACCNLAQVYAALGDQSASRRLFKFCLKLARQLGDLALLTQAFAQLGSLYRSAANYDAAIRCFRSQLHLVSQQQTASAVKFSPDAAGQASLVTATAGWPSGWNVVPSNATPNWHELLPVHYNLSVTYIEMQQSANALKHLYQLLELSRTSRARVFESEALYQIACYYLKKREFLKAIPYFEQDLILVQELASALASSEGATASTNSAASSQSSSSVFGTPNLVPDPSRLASVHNLRMKESQLLNKLGFIYYELREFKQALVYFQQDLLTVSDTQRSTENNATGVSDKVRESQARAHFNIALCNKQLKDFQQAFDALQRYFQIYSALDNVAGKLRALYEIADVYVLMQQYESAIVTFEKVLKTLRQLSVKSAKNSGSIGNLAEASSSANQKTTQSKVPPYADFTIKVLNALGMTYFQKEQFDFAERYYVEALGTVQKVVDGANVNSSSMSVYFDLKCRILKNLGALAKRLAKHDEALAYYEQLLELTNRSRLNALDLQMHAYNQLAQLKIAQRSYRDAIDLLTRELDAIQLALRPHSTTTALSSTTSNTSTAYVASSSIVAPAAAQQTVGGSNAAFNTADLVAEQIEVYLLLGDAYAKLIFAERDGGEMLPRDTAPQPIDTDAIAQLATRYYEHACHQAEQASDLPQQYQAYRGLATFYRRLGNLQQAIVYYEKCLLLAHELKQPLIKTITYGELGCLHTLQQNYEQAITCLQNQLTIAREIRDQHAEAAAASSLGNVYTQMDEYTRALEFHQLELRIAVELNDPTLLQRAYSNCGLAYEAIRDYTAALRCQQLHLQMATVTNDQNSKLLAYSSLGRLHHHVAHYQEAVQYLQAALQLAEQCDSQEEQARLHHRLALSLWATSNLPATRTHLYRAIDLFEHFFTEQCRLRRPASSSTTKAAPSSKTVKSAELDSDFQRGTLHKRLEQDPASMRDMQMASYESLQKLLLAEQRIEDALSISERAKCVDCCEFFVAHNPNLVDGPHVIAQNATLLNSAIGSSSASTHSTASSGDVSSVTASFVQKSLSLSPHSTSKQRHAQLKGTDAHMRVDASHSSGLANLREIAAFEYQPLISEQIVDVARRQRLHILHYSFVNEHLCIWFVSALNRLVRFHQVVFSRSELAPLVRAIRTCFGADSSVETGGETKSMLETDLEDLLSNPDSTPADSATLFNPTPSGNASAITTQNGQPEGDISGMHRSASAQNLASLFAFAGGPQQTGDKAKVREVSGKTSRKALKGVQTDTMDDRECSDAIERLYTVLVAHFEADLREIEALEAADGADARRAVSSSSSFSTVGASGPRASLIVVADAEFLQVPFALLTSRTLVTRGRSLGERFSLVHVPCVSTLIWLQLTSKVHAKQQRTISQRLALVASTGSASSTAGSSNAVKDDVLIVGAPQFTRSLELRWNMLKPIRHSERECSLTANLFNTRALLHGDVSKSNLIGRIHGLRFSSLASEFSASSSSDLQSRLGTGDMAIRMELVHISLPICFRLSAFLCSTNSNAASVNAANMNQNAIDESYFFSLADCLLSFDEIIKLGLRSRVLVLTLTDTQDHLTSDNVRGYHRLLNAFLFAGAECVIAQRWRTSDQHAHALFLKSLFNHLLQSVPACEALSRAQAQLRADAKFRHARFWSNWFCVGNVRAALTNQLLRVYSVIAELIRSVPYKEMRDAVRILLHLVEKSLARIELEQSQRRIPMFVSLASLETRIGHSRIWPEVLRSVGFRFEQRDNSQLQLDSVSLGGASNFSANMSTSHSHSHADSMSLAATRGDASQRQMFVFFPQTNLGSRLTQCSVLFQAILGLPPNTLVALSKLLLQRDSPAVGESMMALLSQALAQLSNAPISAASPNPHTPTFSVANSSAQQGAAELKVNAQLWRTAGCHEFLASLGFDLVGISNNSEVTIKSSKQLKRHNLQLALTLVSTLFECSNSQAAPPVLTFPDGTGIAGNVLQRERTMSERNDESLDPNASRHKQAGTVASHLAARKPMALVTGSTSQNITAASTTTAVVAPFGNTSGTGSGMPVNSSAVVNTAGTSQSQIGLFKPIYTELDTSKAAIANHGAVRDANGPMLTKLNHLPPTSNHDELVASTKQQRTGGLANSSAQQAYSGGQVQQSAYANSDSDSIGPEIVDQDLHRQIADAYSQQQPPATAIPPSIYRDRPLSTITEMSEMATASESGTARREREQLNEYNRQIGNGTSGIVAVQLARGIHPQSQSNNQNAPLRSFVPVDNKVRGKYENNAKYTKL